MIIEDITTGRKIYYAPGLGEIEPHVREALQNVDCVLVDGTFWQHDEMERAGISKKRALEMGHLPQSGAGGMMEELQRIKARKILIHINNTNPILDAGIEVTHDGLMISL